MNVRIAFDFAIDWRRKQIAISPTFFCRTERLFTFHHFQFPQIAHFIYNMTSYYENHFAISCPSLRYCQRQLAAAGSTSCYRILRIVSDSWQYTWFSQLEEPRTYAVEIQVFRKHGASISSEDVSHPPSPSFPIPPPVPRRHISFSVSTYIYRHLHVHSWPSGI